MGNGDYVTREAFYRFPKGLFYSDLKDKEGSYIISTAGVLVLGRVFATKSNTEEQIKLHNLTKIEYTARLRYLSEADRRVMSMWVSSILYSVAIAFVVIITVNQTIAVLTAAGWLK